MFELKKSLWKRGPQSQPRTADDFVSTWPSHPIFSKVSVFYSWEPSKLSTMLVWCYSKNIHWSVTIINKNVTALWNIFMRPFYIDIDEKYGESIIQFCHGASETVNPPKRKRSGHDRREKLSQKTSLGLTIFSIPLKIGLEQCWLFSQWKNIVLKDIQ